MGFIALHFLSLNIQNHYAASGTSSSVVGQHTSIQSRDSYGMRTFNRVFIIALLTWLIFDIKDVYALKGYFILLSEA